MGGFSVLESDLASRSFRNLVTVSSMNQHVEINSVLRIEDDIV